MGYHEKMFPQARSPSASPPRQVLEKGRPQKAKNAAMAELDPSTHRLASPAALLKSAADFRSLDGRERELRNARIRLGGLPAQNSNMVAIGKS